MEDIESMMGSDNVSVGDEVGNNAANKIGQVPRTEMSASLKRKL